MTQATADPKYHEIRPYIDEEAQKEARLFLEDPEVRKILPQLMPNTSEEERSQVLAGIHSIRDFKTQLVYQVGKDLIERTTFSVSSSGKSGLDRRKNYTFISNHRDIVLDPTLLNIISFDNDLPLPRIAIGNNLLARPWIKRLVRLCDAFIVKRDLPIREQLQESKLLSEYVRDSVTKDRESVWIAQREGRAKDSNDRTQTALLKMLTMSSDKEIEEALEELNIVPLALSYEYDPCDYLKAKELLQVRLNPEHTKAPGEDLTSMYTGITGYKGRVHLAFGTPLNDLVEKADESKGRQARLQQIANTIDRQIHLGYRIYPGNYIAVDLLNGDNRYKELYSDSERAHFESYIDAQLDKITMAQKDPALLKEYLLLMYANPLINQMKAKGLMI